MKKILSVVLTGLFILMLVSCAPGGIKVDLTYNNGTSDAKTIGAEFYYPEDAGYEITAEVDFAELYDAEEDYTLQISLYDDERYVSEKAWAEENVADSYKEVEMLGYSGYSYNTVGGFSMFLVVEEPEESYRYVAFELENSHGGEEAEKFFNESKEVQDVVKSFKYLGEIQETAE